MYSRSYFNTSSEISVPDNYDGTAFSDDNLQEEIKTPKIESAKNEIKFSPKSDNEECNSSYQGAEYNECSARERRSENSRFGLDFKGIFGSLFSGEGFSSFLPNKFGVEEILIIGIALFLLFSPEKDIECAFLLLALIFIK